MKKTLKATIIVSISLLIIGSTNTKVFAVGGGGSYQDTKDKPVILDSNSHNSGGSTTGTSNSSKSDTPPVVHHWYDDIVWDYKNNVQEWVDNKGYQVVYQDQSTSDKTTFIKQNWHWVFQMSPKPDGTFKTYLDTTGGQKYTFIAPEDGYYYITSTPKGINKKYFYARTVYTVYDMDMNVIKMTGEEPNTVVLSETPVEQTEKKKEWRLFLKKGQKFDGDFDTIIIPKEENMNVEDNMTK